MSAQVSESEAARDSESISLSESMSVIASQEEHKVSEAASLSVSESISLSESYSAAQSEVATASENADAAESLYQSLSDAGIPGRDIAWYEWIPLLLNYAKYRLEGMSTSEATAKAVEKLGLTDEQKAAMEQILVASESASAFESLYDSMRNGLSSNSGVYSEYDHPDQMAVSPDFTGDVCWKGSYALQLSGDFGQTMSQAVFWRNNIPIQPGQTIDFWLEYAKPPGIELSFRAIQFAAGSRCDIIGTWEFSGERMDEIMSIRAEEKSFLFVSLSARGSGTLEVIALHDRHSRGPYGHFMPGGERFLTSRREEIFCYFDPGDRKPPLNVYFSGYKTREGFEGYNLMRGMGGPFLLISDSRLEGGAFYTGSEEYEALMTSVLRKYMQELGFGEQDVILSGISMGSTGALYYGCDIRPHAVVVGKPLANLGTIAANEKLIRPGGFPTSLDLLLTREGDLSREAVARLDERFWRKFRAADWSDTKLIVSYMLEDDYDRCAYEQMVESLSTGSASIYGRGLHGRHNDNTGGIVQWFASEYKRLLQDDFAQFQSETRREMLK